MTHPIDDVAPPGDDLASSTTDAARATEAADKAPAPAAPLPKGDAASDGVDPVVGAGITLLGIFLMGTGGARDSHLVFDIGVLVAIGGAMVFALFVALSALRLRRTPAPPDGIDDETIAVGPSGGTISVPPPERSTPSDSKA